MSQHTKNKTGMYGLPTEVKFCAKCVMTNQRPSSCVEFKSKPGVKKSTISFDENGVCDACKYTARKSSIDWKQRAKQLKDLCDRFRSKDGSYDCVVPGSGGKDSVKAAYVLRYEYNMHPLLVTWPPHIYTYMGRRNMTSWFNAGFDNISYMPNQRAHRLLTKFAFEKLLHPFQPFIIGQKNLAPKISVQYNIPLVMYGENEAEYGNPQGDNEKPTRDPKWYSSDARIDDIYLGGVCARQLMDEYKLTKADLEPYLPVDPYQLEKVGTEVHYLGYYLRWDPQESYYYAVENTDFLPNDERTEGSFTKYSGIDDKMDWFHFFTTFTKFGIGRATYDASQEIRNNHITREEGIRLVRRFDGEIPKIYLKDNLEYMGISEQRFWEVIDQGRPRHLWEKKSGIWKLRHQINFNK